MRPPVGFAVPWDLHPLSLHAEFSHNTDLLLTLDHSAIGRRREVGVSATTAFGLGGGLCVHVLRFRQAAPGAYGGGGGGGAPAKAAEPLGFPLEGLDLSAHLCETAPAEARYDLCALIQHHGSTIHSGHYTAFCKGRSQGSKRVRRWPTSKARSSVGSHSFWLTFGRVIIPRNGLEA